MTVAPRALLSLLLLAVAVLLPSVGRAEPGTEVVVVLDNSLSMSRNYRWGPRFYPASDPDRRAQLAALILEGLVRDTDDRLTVVPMHGDPIQAGDPDALRAMRTYNRTPYRKPLGVARERLVASPRADRLLVFVTDGLPTDYRDPAEGADILGDDPPFDVVSLALLPDELEGELPRQAMGFLTQLTPDPDAIVRVRRAEELVDAMTTAWAAALGSKPESGTLAPTEARTFRVGKYVTEVFVAVAGASPSGPFVAGLTTEQGEQPPRVSGDNGCPSCRPPATHYATWRLPHDPTVEERVTLRLDRARGDVTYGVILRYDLAARLDLPARVLAGDPVPVRAFLDFRGERVDDPTFFAEDDFAVVASLGDVEVPLTAEPGGWFTGEIEAPGGLVGQDARIDVTFRNTWMAERTRGRVRVEAPPRIDLSAPPLDLGTWRGARGPVERCEVLTLAGDRPDQVVLTPAFEGVPDDVTLTATPLAADDTPASSGATSRWRICAVSAGCCGAATSTDATAVVFTPDNPLVQGTPPRTSVRLKVEPTGFLTCWWPWLLGLLLLLLLLFVLIGLFRGHDFEPDATVRVAGSERQLNRATAVVLREQPGGRRGFYRSARICLTATGEFVRKPGLAAVHVEAVRGGTRLHLRGPLERKDRRTRKMVPVTEEEALDGPITGVVYRCGGLWLRFE